SGAKKRRLGGGTWLTVLAWVVALLMFLPIAWLLLTAFKTEGEAFTYTPHLFFTPTLESFETALAQGAGYWHYAWNSAVTSVVSTAIGLALTVPAAYAMAFYPSKRTDFTLVWMVSIKFIPAVGVLVPIFLIYKTIGLVDNVWGLIILYTVMNLPIMIWMIDSCSRAVPEDLVEAADIDGASMRRTMTRIVLPLATPGLASTCLLALILAWNESFWSITMTNHSAATLAVFIASFKSAEGMFWAKMSAASILSIAPIIVLGWIAQRQMVRGLTFGAVK